MCAQKWQSSPTGSAIPMTDLLLGHPIAWPWAASITDFQPPPSTTDCSQEICSIPRFPHRDCHHGLFPLLSLNWSSVGFRWFSGKESTCPCRRLKRHRFDPRVGEVLWRRKWHPTPVFLPGESHEQRSLVGYVHGVAESRTWLSTHT